MFVDICYPKGNENEFMKVAAALGTKKLCFIYEKPTKIETSFTGTFLQNHASFSFLDLEKKIPQRKNFIYCIQNLEDEKKHFNKPSKILTQVYIKDIKENLLGISFHEIVNNPKQFEKIVFYAKMAKKYKIRLFIASFARSPYMLRPKEELLAFSRFILKDQLYAKNTVNVLFSRLTESF